MPTNDITHASDLVEEAFYWVKREEEEGWEPAQWIGGHWYFLGSAGGHYIGVATRIGHRLLPPGSDV